MYSFNNWINGQLILFPPSPIPYTSLQFDINYNTFHDTFYGIDFQDDFAVQYSQHHFYSTIHTNTKILRKFLFKTFILFDYHWFHPDNDETLSAYPGFETAFTTNIGCEFAYDSRDNSMNPWEGVYLGLGCEFTHPYLLGSSAFIKLNLDARFFLHLPFDHVLAMQFLPEIALAFCETKRHGFSIDNSTQSVFLNDI